MEVSVTNFHQHIIDIENLFVQYISNGKPPDIFLNILVKYTVWKTKLRTLTGLIQNYLNPVH